MALGVTLTKRWGRPEGASPTAYAGWRSTAGGMFLVPVKFLLEGMPPAIDGEAALGCLWLGLVRRLVAYVLWFRGIATAGDLCRRTRTAVADGRRIARRGAARPVARTGRAGRFALALAAILAGQISPTFKKQHTTPTPYTPQQVARRAGDKAMPQSQKMNSPAGEGQPDAISVSTPSTRIRPLGVRIEPSAQPHRAPPRSSRSPAAGRARCAAPRGSVSTFYLDRESLLEPPRLPEQTE